MAAAATAASVAASASATTTLPAAPMTPAPQSILKPHPNEAKVPNTTEHSLLIQNRSIKKASIVTNALSKPMNATASANAHTDTAAAPTQTATNDIDLTAPQSIAYVAGRKFIMVPKTAKAHTSPDLANEKSVAKSS